MGDITWRNGVFYQIYPRSFCDSTGSGMGDLRGITQRLDYIQSLGVDGMWISPFFKSPMKDFGYDVSDYRDVDPIFGTLEDFDQLLSESHKRGLKVIIDLVLSHTSDQHPWFNDPAKKDYYVWADAKYSNKPNNWVSLFGGSAWQWSDKYKQYYLHNFLKEQPDLNYHNPNVQNEALDIVKFWLDRGVDGLRLDVINFLFHDPQLRDNPPRSKELGVATQFEGDDPYSDQMHIYDKSRPEMLPFLEKLRALVDTYDDRFMVGEIGDDHPYQRAVEYTAGQRLHTTYNPQIMSGAHKALDANIIRQPIEEFAKQVKSYGGGHPAWAFSNHDVVRADSRWCKDGDGFRHDPRLSKILIALLGCLHGTLFLYQGEELGLPEVKLSYDQLQDPWGKRLWPEWQGRDGCRTPMPWDNNMPDNQWLPIPAVHLALNAAAQEKQNDSILNFTREFFAWRKAQPALLLGSIEFVKSDLDCLAFKRICDEQTLLCHFQLSAPYSYSIE